MGTKTDSPVILIAEDDVDLTEQMSDTLRAHGFAPIACHTWNDAWAQAQNAAPALIILDQWLGKVDTLPLITQLRGISDAAIVVVTGNRAEVDRIVGLELGADDFLLKPISGRELVARIRARLRRQGPAAEPVGLPAPSSADWCLDLRRRQLLTPEGHAVALTGAEFDLLALLAEAPGTPVDRSVAMKAIFKRELRFADRAVDNLVYQLRRKLAEHGGENLVKTIRNRGYFTSVGVVTRSSGAPATVLASREMAAI